ncbi:helix-turn-helix domain-containing protein [Streptomyces sp. SID8366]|uniref:helix-turn-helix domain-containing protein n=1 Tax=unclassified Streptomyces TaxID=2593676 RepID=UPI000DBA634B|nr:helix-turn-helix transcriptional regulator [Streptomyces sp. PsTaAH-130]MYU06038.1 helix-turn-helix domain-containing protein [Streptomyces sp. SID8366]MYU67469.1 helix-turn-helix domain-containing protein [Streptomyces sp. SID69]RAJ64102.1 helix-turn-helix protein [Streptomyces sp. PsTaAH-130]
MTTASGRGARDLVRQLVAPAKEGHLCGNEACHDASVDDIVVGAVLRAARERAGVSPASAAACIGVREARILRLEAGRATWNPEHAHTLADRYAMTGEEVVEMRQLITPRHHHALPDIGAVPAARLAALEARAAKIRVASRTVPPFLYGWDSGSQTLPGLRQRPWPGCPVTLLWDDVALEFGEADTARSAARLRHLAAMVDAGVLEFHILIPDYGLPFEPVGSELTLADSAIVFAQEESLMVTYSNGPHARWKSTSLDTQLAAALGPGESLAALQGAAQRFEQA